MSKKIKIILIGSAALFLVIVILVTTSGEPKQSEYSKAIDNFTAQQEQTNQQYANYLAVTANLTNQLNQSQVNTSQLQAALSNTQAELKRLKIETQGLPALDELRLAKQLLGEAMAGEATARMMYELKVKDFKALENDYLSTDESLENLMSKLESINARTDNITTGNITEEQRDAFFEIWDILWRDNITGSLRWFGSVEELEQWVKDNRLPEVMIADSKGLIDFKNYSGNPKYDCDDYAKDLVLLAESQGYKLMECPVKNGYVWNKKVVNLYGNHVGTWTRIGNAYYYIESSPSNSGVVKISNID